MTNDRVVTGLGNSAIAVKWPDRQLLQTRAGPLSNGRAIGAVMGSLMSGRGELQQIAAAAAAA